MSTGWVTPWEGRFLCGTVSQAGGQGSFGASGCDLPGVQGCWSGAWASVMRQARGEQAVPGAGGLRW